MQSGAPTFGTPEPALVLYAMAVAGPAARRPVPLRRLAVRLEDRRRPGRLRERGDAPADRPRRRQLRAPRGRLARGRAGRRLREVHPRRRPVRDDGRVREGRRPVRERPGARRDPRRTARASTSSARPTRWPTSRPRSTAPRSPTTTRFEQWQEDGGARRRPARERDLEADARASTRRRRSTRPSTRRCSSSSSGARRRCRTRRSDGGALPPPRPASTPASRAALRRPLADPTFELLPLKNALDQAAHLPAGRDACR